MKAISVKNPWASFIAWNVKRYEYRSWQTDYRGDLLICSSASPKMKDFMPSGYALAIANVTGVYKVTTENYKEYDLVDEDAPDENEKLYAWKLENIRVVKPFPVKGKLNFYTVDDDLIEVLFDYNGLSEDEIDELQDWHYENYCLPIMNAKSKK